MGSLLAYMGEYVARLAVRAVERVRGVVGEYGSLPVVVSFSGGKDSSAALAVSVDALGSLGVAGYFIHIPGQTITDNVLAARRVAGELGLLWERVVWEPGRPLPSGTGVVYHVVVRGAPYWSLLERYGPPSVPPRPRWCCRRFKEEPLGFAPCAPAVIGGRRVCARIVVVGVKRVDSRARARRWSGGFVRVFKRRGGGVDVAVAPLVDMSDADVWALLQYYNIRSIVEEQYRKWGRSPNCVLCPLASKRQLERAVKQLPSGFLMRYYEALKNHDGTLAQRLRSVIEEELGKRGVIDG